MEFIFGLIGVLIGGIAAYFLFVPKLQRQLASAERKLERANRAVEESESLRSQQTLQAQELQNERQKNQSLETSYQAQLRNLEQSYELQLQKVEKAQGSPAALTDSQDQIRKIEQSYEAKIQSLKADREQEKQAIYQSHQSQIRELQQRHNQALEEIQQRQALPTQSFDAPPETQQASSWGVPAAIAGVAGVAGWAASSFLNREQEEAPAVEEPIEEQITEELITKDKDWPVEESPFEIPEDQSEETLEDNWADQPLEEAIVAEPDLAAWIEPEKSITSEEIPENLTEETSELTLDENWADQPLEEVIVAEPNLAAWIEPEESIHSLEEGIGLSDSWGLDETVDPLSEIEPPPLEALDDISDSSMSSDLDFLSLLQGEETPISESEEFSSFKETSLPDFLGGETLNEDLPFLDMFSADAENLADIPETLASETNDPFINFFDSDTGKSDIEFLEMLKSNEADTGNQSGLYESDDLFGDLFSSEETKSTDIDDLFDSTEPNNSKTDQDGLLELFADDVLSFDDWDLSDPDKSSLP